MSGRGGDAKRPREDDTDRIVAEALEREALEREAKKSAGKGKGKSKKEKAPVEVPEGPVLEGLLENVHSRRVAQKRDHQGQGDEDTNFVANVRDIETNLEVAEEDGVKFEAFNFEAEREEGHFDEDGHFIWNETNEEGKDAWLDSKDGGKVCSKKAQEQHEQMLQRMKEMDAARPMAPSDIRKLAGEAAGMLLPGETVVQGLRRLGGKGQKKGGKQDKKQASGPQSSEADPVLFARLTEAADTLVGEMDVYAFTREQLEKEAGLVQGGADEADMFADSDEDAPADATGTSCGKGAATVRQNLTRPSGGFDSLLIPWGGVAGARGQETPISCRA
eukprot:evm.model.scf_1052.3 EVM.evm.TU.scf_1052.3   scf_1052:26423-30595(-)